MDYPNVPLHELMRRTVERYPDRTAIVFKDRRISFSEFDRESNRLAHALADLGLRQGERLGLFMPNCPEYELAFYAASKLGAVPSPLNPAYKEREVIYQANDAGICLLVTHESVLAVVEAANPELNTVRDVLVIDSPRWRDLLASQPDDPPDVDVSPDSLAALPFSSGTTGLPKGVMLTHRNLVCNHIQFSIASQLGADDAYVVYMPLYHIYGVALMGLSMYSGAKQIVLERFDVVPPVLLALANAPDLRPEQFRTIKFGFNAAAPLAPEVARRVEDRLGFRIIQAYGLTEASPCTHHSPLEPHRIKLESGGVPVADTEQRVVDLETGNRDLPPGEAGEILVRGPQVMQGYWNAPEETARALRDGWLYTGDVGYVDDQGYVFLVDRKKEMIKYKAFSVAPAELEGVLLEHPDVADCGVTGVPDDEAGEVPKAFVVLRSGRAATAADLAAFVGERVAGYKQIRQWAFVQSIPRTPSGKILRRMLR